MILVSKRKRGSVTLQQLAVPIEFARLEIDPVDGLQARNRPPDSSEVDALRLGWHRLESIVSAFLAHDHFGAILQPERLGQAKRQRIARLEYLGAVLFSHDTAPVYTECIY